MTRPGFTRQTRATNGGKVKAVGYLRVSDPKQATIDRESLPRQEADIRDYCERRGYEVVRFYADAGISGSSRNRPAFQEMLAGIPTGKFDVIVAWRGDRLTRGLRPTVALKDALEGTEVQLEASNDYVDRRQLSIKAAFAEEELEAIRERTRMGAFGRARKGKLKGKIKYGYGMDLEGYPEIDEAKAQVVRRIFELYLTTDLAATGIGKLLTEECVPSPGGGRWYPAVVSTILRDTTYIGQGHWNRLHHYRKDDGKGRDRVITVYHDRDQWLDIAYPPIITEETFKAAERRRRNYTQPRRAGPDTPDFPLKGVLWCPVHLCNYTTSHTRRDGRVAYRYYRCLAGSRNVEEKGPCPQPNVNAEDVEFRVFVWVGRYLLRPENLNLLREEYVKRLKSGGGQEAMEKAEREIEKLVEERRRVIRAFELAGEVDASLQDEHDLRVKLASIQERMELRQEQLEQANATYGDLAETVLALDALSEQAQRSEAWKNVVAKFPVSSPESRNKLVRWVINRAYYTGNPDPERDLECVVNLQHVAELSEPLTW